MERDHTFLFSRGMWAFKGKYSAEDGETYTAEGDMLISHTTYLWKCDMKIKFPGSGIPEMVMAYDIVPFPDNETSTVWETVHPKYGKMIGKFNIVDDSIIATYATGDGQTSGIDNYKMIDASNYRYKGAIISREGISGNWVLEMVKVI